MKKTFSILCTALAFSVVSCSGAGSKSDSDTDTATETVGDAIIPSYNLSDNGVDDIVLGMLISEIPDSIPGLYNKVDKYDGKSFAGFSFVQGSIEMFNAEDTDFDGKLNLIAVRGESPLKAATGNGTLYIGMPEADLLDPKGSALVRKEGAFYRIGAFNVEVQDGRVSEIFIERVPAK